MRYGVVCVVFFIIKPQTALYYAVWCIVNYGAVRLYHFVSGFSTIFAVCAVLRFGKHPPIVSLFFFPLFYLFMYFLNLSNKEEEENMETMI